MNQHSESIEMSFREFFELYKRDRKPRIRENTWRTKEAIVNQKILPYLRHSHVSLLIELGFSATAIADRVGHESIDITYRYAHFFPIKHIFFDQSHKNSLVSCKFRLKSLGRL